MQSVPPPAHRPAPDDDDESDLTGEQEMMKAMGLPYRFSHRPIEIEDKKNKNVASSRKAKSKPSSHKVVAQPHSNNADHDSMDIDDMEEGEIGVEEGEITDTPSPTRKKPEPHNSMTTNGRRKFDGYSFANDMLEFADFDVPRVEQSASSGEC